VVRGRAARDQGCLDPGFGKRYRRRQPGRAAADNRYFHG
jgi:hypothetical protein